ncbi:flagellar basal body rod protein FlgC [Granulicella cerasi]|uniref:Flagellar basal-body rod protein FlgC n=1 Tax=Granulicella cerasi TaxID=741063 RepID=A0ABW1Z4D0_9BACT|nr:flagellar basal body rod protein FlgC [Granulicella cerasi]
MNLFGVMDISGSALKAERMRAEVSAANMANAETTRTADGTPYRRQQVVFESNDLPSFRNVMQGPVNMPTMLSRAGLDDSSAVPGGVAISAVSSDDAAPLMRYEPGHPDADANGYVAYPDINPVTEMVDLMGASRAYGANASALQAEKSMVSASLDILK